MEPRKLNLAPVFKLAFLLTLLASGTGFSSPLKKKIVIVHSYIPGEWYHGLNRGFEETLGKLGVTFDLTPIVYDSEFWLSRSKTEQQIEQSRIISQIVSIKPDLVVICDDEAADALVVGIGRSGFPIIFTGIGRPGDGIDWLKKVPGGEISGVLEVYPVAKFMDVLEKLLPSVKTISILSSKKPSSEIICDSVEKEMNSKNFKNSHRVQLRSVNKLRFWEEWKQAIEGLNSKDNAVWVLVPYDVKDTNNLQVPLPQMGRWFRKHLRIPYIGMSVVHTKMGGFMSVQITPYDLGRQAAEMASKFFSGTNLANLPVEKGRYHQIEINVTEANRLKVRIPKELLGVVTLVENPALKYGR